MSPAANKAIIRRLTEAFNEGDLDIVGEVAAPEFVLHQPWGDDVHGPAGLIRFLAAVCQAMPDIQQSIRHILAEGDLVAIHLPISATFTKDFMGIPANNARVETTALNLWRLRDGRVVEAWFNLDTLGLMKQMGAVPA